MDDLTATSKIAAAGMRAQNARLRVVSQNLANADSLAKTPGGEPYRRKTITFDNELNRALGIETIRADKIREDDSELEREYKPDHPGADQNGYVLKPNVNPLIEVMDMKEAQRSYEANLKVMDATRDMKKQTVDLMK